MKIDNKMSTPLLSVCLITYNHVKYIRETIDGILMQKVNFPWELIIADDFSMDGTREIILEYKEKYPDFIKLIFQEKNVGPAKNWLDLITYPKSKYIAYLEGDDYWTDPLKLQKQVDYMEAHTECTMCFSAAEIITGDSKKTGNFVRPCKGNRIFTTGDMILGGGDFFHTGSVLFKKNIIDTLPQWCFEAPAGDYPLALICAHKGTVAYIDDIMSVHRSMAKGSWTESMMNNKKNNMEHLNGMIEMLNCFNRYSDGKFEAAVLYKINWYKKYLLVSQEESNCLKDPQNKEIFQLLSADQKVKFILKLYFPRTFKILFKIKHSLLKHWKD